jgi:hypothetical protein
MMDIAGRNVLTRSRVPVTGRAEQICAILGVKIGHWLKTINLSILALQRQVAWLTLCGIGFDII